MEKRQIAQSNTPRLNKFEEYLYANLMAWGFLAVIGAISFFTCGGAWDAATKGVMEFLFLIIGGGITLVSVMDYFYDRYSADTSGEKQG